MLKFLPRIKAVSKNDIFFIQQMVVGYNADWRNCDYCYYKYTWTDPTTRRECSEKHKCEYSNQPWINLDVLHEQEIDDTTDPEAEYRRLYYLTRVTRQVKLKGWPLYLQFIGCRSPQPQCNACCFFHNERLRKHQTVAACAHTHGCSRSGSFFDLLVPTNADLYEQFFRELNSMQP